MDLIGEFIARVLASPDDERGARRWCAPRWKRCAGSSRCTRTCWPRRARRRASSPTTARSRGRVPDFEPRPGQRDMAAAVARVLRPRRRPARRGRHRHRQDAGLPGARHPERAARARVHRHQEPAGADLLQGPAAPARGARRAVHRHLHEGPRQLPVPAPVRGVARRHRGRLAARTGVYLRDGRRLGRRHRDRRPRRARRTCPRTCRSGRASPPPPRTASAATARSTTTASSRACASAPPPPTW